MHKVMHSQIFYQEQLHYVTFRDHWIKHFLSVHWTAITLLRLSDLWRGVFRTYCMQKSSHYLFSDWPLIALVWVDRCHHGNPHRSYWGVQLSCADADNFCCLSASWGACIWWGTFQRVPDLQGLHYTLITIQFDWTFDMRRWEVTIQAETRSCTETSHRWQTFESHCLCIQCTSINFYTVSWLHWLPW